MSHRDHWCPGDETTAAIVEHGEIAWSNHYDHHGLDKRSDDCPFCGIERRNRPPLPDLDSAVSVAVRAWRDGDPGPLSELTDLEQFHALWRLGHSPDWLMRIQEIRAAGRTLSVRPA